MGVEHVVFNAYLHADSDERNPLRIVEKHLAKSGLAYTILRPNFFMENFSTGFLAPMIAGGKIFIPAGDNKTSFISVSDIAKVTAAIFREKSYGTEYNLTGPEALSYGEATKIISDVSGRAVTVHSHLRNGNDAGRQGTGDARKRHPVHSSALRLWCARA